MLIVLFINNMFYFNCYCVQFDFFSYGFLLEYLER
jgi:hypothetical protein